MKTTLADQCRTHGVAVGDVIELMTRPDDTDTVVLMTGCLVEITAIGDRHILGYRLEGIGSSDRYQDMTWTRRGKETMYDHATAMRKVGHRDATDYVWLLPELENVYTRCQHSQNG